MAFEIFNGTLIKYMRETGEKEVVVPEGVTKIGHFAFRACGLSKITIPEGVKSISNKAFYSASIKTLVIPSTVEELDIYVQKWFTGLRDIYIHGKVPIPGDYSFIITIHAPQMSPKDVKGTNIRRGMAVAYCMEPDQYTPDIAKEYDKYLISQRRYFEPIAKDGGCQPVLQYYAALDAKAPPKPVVDDSLAGKIKQAKKSSPLNRVLLLEDTLMNGTLEELRQVLEECAPFEFTARVLGLACRFKGSDAVKLLLEHGATFAYAPSATFTTRYNCKRKISNKLSLDVDYSLYIFPAVKVEGYTQSFASDAERIKSVQLLANGKENLSEMLYYAIMYDDTVVYDALKKIRCA